MDTILAVIIFAFLFPLILTFLWKKISGAKLTAFLVGALCFTLFATVLESVLHSVILTGNSPLSKTIMSSTLLYMLYTAFAAGIFEETGRYCGFRYLLKRQNDASCSVAYGIGHGGMEVVILLGTTYIMLALTQNGLSLGDDAATETLLATAASITPSTAALAIAERISALMAHVGLSVLVFTAVRQPAKWWRYPLAIFLHALLDAPAALYQLGTISSVLFVELLAFLFGASFLFFGIRAYRDYNAAQEDM